MIIGYRLGDVNVLTAVDWTKNVYSGQRINYPHDIIQLLYTENPKNEPYRDRNDILIVELNDLKSTLNEIADITKKESEKELKRNSELTDLNEIFKNPREEHVKKFIDNEIFRKSVIDAIAKHDVYLISGFLELFSKAIDETWDRAEPYGAFHAYNENLTLLLDIIENIDLVKIPPALLESIAYNLNRVSYYIGDELGKSKAAYNTWNSRKKNIPSETTQELKNIAKSRHYHNLKNLLNR